jgi:hypothetical protein
VTATGSHSLPQVSAARAGTSEQRHSRGLGGLCVLRPPEELGHNDKHSPWSPETFPSVQTPLRAVQGGWSLALAAEAWVRFQRQKQASICGYKTTGTKHRPQPLHAAARGPCGQREKCSHQLPSQLLLQLCEDEDPSARLLCTCNPHLHLSKQETGGSGGSPEPAVGIREPGPSGAVIWLLACTRG